MHYFLVYLLFFFFSFSLFLPYRRKISNDAVPDNSSSRSNNTGSRSRDCSKFLEVVVSVHFALIVIWWGNCSSGSGLSGIGGKKSVGNTAGASSSPIITIP